MNDIDTRIRAALHAVTDSITEGDLRPEIEPGTRIEQRRPWLAPVLAAAAVVALGAGVATLATRSTNHPSQAGGFSSQTAEPSNSLPGTAGRTVPTNAPDATSSAPGEQSPPATLRKPQLWPFASLADADHARAAWHFDARETARRFVQGRLGYGGLSPIPGRAVTGADSEYDAAVDVGYRQDGDWHLSGEVVLARIGSGHRLGSAAWQVIDVIMPASELAISHTVVGGNSLRAEGILSGGGTVDVRALAGVTGMQAAAGSARVPSGTDVHWSVTVDDAGPVGTALTVIAATGGTAAAPAMLAVTG